MRLVIESDFKNVEVSLYNNSTDKKPTDKIKVDVTTYASKLKTLSFGIKNSVLPPAVRYFDHAEGVVLFERPPCYVPFSFSPTNQSVLSSEKSSRLSVQLPIPWQRYVARLGPTGLPHCLYVFFSNHAMESLDEELNCAPIPNLYGNSSVCLPVYDHLNVADSMDLTDAVYHLYDLVWGSGFNLDVFQVIHTWARTQRQHPLMSPVLS